MRKKLQTEYHPLKPFLPPNAKLLMLGSFPPKRQKWSMDFFYPNFQNDMWRIMGLIFYGDKNHFALGGERRFDYAKIVEFCSLKGIAIFDTALAVKRLNADSSDNFLEIIEKTDIKKLLEVLPNCNAVVATGLKAAELISELMQATKPKIGKNYTIIFENRNIEFYRMPSSSRAYPLSLDKKAESYKEMFKRLKII